MCQCEEINDGGRESHEAVEGWKMKTLLPCPQDVGCENGWLQKEEVNQSDWIVTNEDEMWGRGGDKSTLLEKSLSRDAAAWNGQNESSLPTSLDGSPPIHEGRNVNSRSAMLQSGANVVDKIAQKDLDIMSVSFWENNEVHLCNGFGEFEDFKTFDLIRYHVNMTMHIVWKGVFGRMGMRWSDGF